MLDGDRWGQLVALIAISKSDASAAKSVLSADLNNTHLDRKSERRAVTYRNNVHVAMEPRKSHCELSSLLFAQTQAGPNPPRAPHSSRGLERRLDLHQVVRGPPSIGLVTDRPSAVYGH